VTIGPTWSVESTADVTVTAEDWISVEGAFSVEMGAEFKAFTGN
jgi:hypothetical protein